MRTFADEMAELEAGLSKRRIEDLRMGGHAARLARVRDGRMAKKAAEAKPPTVTRKPIRKD